MGMTQMRLRDLHRYSIVQTRVQIVSATVVCFSEKAFATWTDSHLCTAIQIDLANINELNLAPFAAVASLI